MDSKKDLSILAGSKRDGARLRLAAAWIVLQAIFLAGWATGEELRLREGVTILVPTQPVDPRDPLRGQYINLNYAFNRPPSWNGGADDRGSTVWVVMAPDGGFHRPIRTSLNRPKHLQPGEVAMAGTAQDWRIEFGVERYFVPEGSETPNQRDITVLLRIGADGSPRIDTVFVKGVRW
jgi:uncharacterized membrane-anchored protein